RAGRGRAPAPRTAGVPAAGGGGKAGAQGRRPAPGCPPAGGPDPSPGGPGCTLSRLPLTFAQGKPDGVPPESLSRHRRTAGDRLVPVTAVRCRAGRQAVPPFGPMVRDYPATGTRRPVP